MNAAHLIDELRHAGIRVEPRGDRLRVEGRIGAITPDLRERLAENKPALLAYLGSLPGRVRQRFADTCARLQIDSGAVLTQFDLWRYSQSDLLEMEHWPDECIEHHARLLQFETQQVDRSA